MRIALKQLGYEDTYHFAACMQNPLDAIMWDEALEAKYFGRGNLYGKRQWDQPRKIWPARARKNYGRDFVCCGWWNKCSDRSLNS